MDEWIVNSGIMGSLTFAFKHANKLGTHSHRYIGDETDRNLLSVG